MKGFLFVFGLVLAMWWISDHFHGDDVSEWERQDARAAYYGY